MANSHFETVKYFSLHCVDSATFYVCEGCDNEFIGCCTSDPCRDGSGICPDGHLRMASFAADKSDELKKQSCDDTRGSSVWWVCPDTDPPFMGCCDISPCGEGCSRSNLLPAVLSKNKENRQAFLDPEGFTSTISASAATSTASSSSPSNDDSGGLGTGAIVGIAVGSAAVFLILLSLLICICWRRQRKRKQTGEKVQSREFSAASDPNQSPMGYNGQYFPSASTVVPHYSSGFSIDQHNKPSPPLGWSNELFSPNTSSNINSTFRGSYDQPFLPMHMMTVHEMDGVDRTPQELSTDPLETYEDQNQSPDMDQAPPQNQGYFRR